MNEQPKWECIANLGDVNPIDHGGLFVFVDKTGAYPPEVECLEEPQESEAQVWIVYRFVLEPCTYINGILSDNPYHPEIPALFARDYRLRDMAEAVGLSAADFAYLFCSDDAVTRARAWREVGLAWGFDELDDCPLNLSRQETWGRYSSRIRKLNSQRANYVR